MGHDSEVNEHELKAALIKKLKPLYAPNEGPILLRAFNKVYEQFFGGYTVNINVDSFSGKDASQISESEKIGRTVFALKKIKEFNHHYFPDNELRILNPAPTGITPEVMRMGFAGLDACIGAYMWRTWSMNPRAFGLLGGLMVSQYVALQLPNLFNEAIQCPRRRNLAKKYIQAYGYDYFHEIVDPRYDLHKLHSIHNKLYH